MTFWPHKPKDIPDDLEPEESMRIMRSLWLPKGIARAGLEMCLRNAKRNAFFSLKIKETKKRDLSIWKAKCGD